MNKYQNPVKIYQFDLNLKIRVKQALILIKKCFVFQFFTASRCKFKDDSVHLFPVTFSV